MRLRSQHSLSIVVVIVLEDEWLVSSLVSVVEAVGLGHESLLMDGIHLAGLLIENNCVVLGKVVVTCCGLCLLLATVVDVLGVVCGDQSVGLSRVLTAHGLTTALVWLDVVLGTLVMVDVEVRRVDIGLDVA